MKSTFIWQHLYNSTVSKDRDTGRCSSCFTTADLEDEFQCMYVGLNLPLFFNRKDPNSYVKIPDKEKVLILSET